MRERGGDVDENKKMEVQEIFQNVKIESSLYPLAVASILYGIQLSVFPGILNTYSVYALIDDFVNHWEVGSLFIVLPLVMLIGFKLRWRVAMIISSTLLLMLWSLFTVAFLLSPPPNTVWIFAALMMYLTFSLTRRV